MKSFYNLLTEYGESEYYPYHMPGHKRRLGGYFPEGIIKADITEIEGFDDLHDASGIILALEERAARLYGADESYYLVNGSTCGIQSAISAAVNPGGTILMARNCHKSAYYTAYLRNLDVEYLYPPKMDGFSLFDAVSRAQVEKHLQANAKIEAVMLVSPTYEGRISPIREIAEVVHKYGKILIVDEAHGAHLGFSEDYSASSVTEGADLVIHSVHKTLPALTQSALLHVVGERVNRDRLRRFLAMYQSSSPSYLLMAGIDNALRIVETNGEVLFSELKTRYDQMIRRLNKMKRLRVLEPKKNLQDIGKLVIDTRFAGISGKELSALLYQNYQLQLEMAAGDYALAMFTIGDDVAGFERMTEALLEIDGLLSSIEPETIQEPEYYFVSEQPKAVMTIGEAWDADSRLVPIAEAKGMVSADFIMLYPPGIPIVVPGEEIDEMTYHHIRHYLDAGFEVKGVVKNEKGLFVRGIYHG